MSQVRDVVLLVLWEEDEGEALLLSLLAWCTIVSSLPAVEAGMTVVVRDVGFESRLTA